MGRDAEVADARVGRQHEVEQGRLAAGAAALLEHVGDGGRANSAPRERLRERGVEGGGADLIEQAQQARGLAGQRMSPDGEGVEEGVGLRAGVAEPIAAAELVGVALLGDEGGEVGVVFDALPAILSQAPVKREAGPGG